jgi:hypothetical protein
MPVVPRIDHKTFAPHAGTKNEAVTLLKIPGCATSFP